LKKKLLVTDIPDSQYEGKRVFVRVDFNVPVNGGKITEDYRIRRTIPTIDYLTRCGARAILASHMGRPKGRRIERLSMAPVAARLNEFLGTKIHFPGAVVGRKVNNTSKRLKNGEVMLLENLRYHSEEQENDADFSKKLASLADIYVNEAFGTSHRAHASTYGMTAYFDKKLAGLMVGNEMKFLSRLIRRPKKPYVVIVGGMKIKDKIGALKNIIKKADRVLIGGGVAYTFLAAQGVNVGKCSVEREMLYWAREALDTYKEKILLPVDHVMAESAGGKKTLAVTGAEILDDMTAFDIGPKTVERFTSHIKGEGTVFWNGPMGFFEVDDFSNGTSAIARSFALATWRGATTVLGGGDSVASLKKSGVKFSEATHVSTGGGACFEFLGGSDLPGISVLSDS
jgi:phosphoglycerate kinase